MICLDLHTIECTVYGVYDMLLLLLFRLLYFVLSVQLKTLVTSNKSRNNSTVPSSKVTFCLYFQLNDETSAYYSLANCTV